MCVVCTYCYLCFHLCKPPICNQSLLLLNFDWVTGFTVSDVATASENICIKKLTLSIMFQILSPFVTKYFFLR